MYSSDEIITEAIDNDNLVRGFYVSEDPDYKTDLDHQFNANGMDFVYKALDEIGYPELKELFYKERIDNQVLVNLDQSAILTLMSKYPVGIRLKFFMALKEFTAKISNSQTDLNISMSSKSLSSNPSSLNENTVDSKTIYKILYQTDAGRRFLAKNPTDQILNSKVKVELCEIICGYLLSEGVKMNRKVARVLSDAIKSIFVKEDPTIYFDGSSGILYAKGNYYNIKYKGEEPVEGEPDKKKIKSESELACEFTIEENNSDDFVRSNPYANLKELMFHWKASHRKRSSHIKALKDVKISDIVGSYKSFARSDGYFMIDADFQYFHPNVSFEENWQKLKQQLTIILPENTSNPRIKSKLEMIDSMSETSKAVSLIYGVHGFLFSRNKLSRDTIEDSFEKMITLVPHEGALSISLNSLREKCLQKKQTLQPFIVCFGDDIESVKENAFLLVFDEFQYKFADFSSTLKALLQIFIVLNLCYPTSSKNVHEFFASVLLHQNCSLKPKCKALKNLISGESYENES